MRPVLIIATTIDQKCPLYFQQVSKNVAALLQCVVWGKEKCKKI